MRLLDKAKEMHREAIVLDGLNALYPEDFNENYSRSLRDGGVSAVKVTIPDVECFNILQMVQDLARWFKRLRTFEPKQMRLATTVREIRKAKDEGAIAVILGSQGAGFLGLEPAAYLDFFARLGMRTMQPTYQQRNQFGSGCGEKRDEGLSELGIQWTEEMNKVGMVISLSHVGYKTSMEVMEVSRDPVIFDHSNPKALCNHVRNITDDQMQKCAERGGVIGLCPIAQNISEDRKPSELNVEDYVNHISYVVDLIGVDHVGLAVDFAEGHYYTPEFIMEERRTLPGLLSKYKREIQDQFLMSGRDKLPFYELYMPWFKSMSETPMITEALLQRGYSDHDLKKILGENFLRVFERVWGS